MKRKILLSLLFCCLLSVLPVGVCSAGEYLMTEEQLTTLNEKLNKLESNLILQTENLQKAKQLSASSDEQILILQQKLTLSQERIMKLEQLLIRSDKQIEILQANLQEAQQSITKTSNSLESANKNLAEYEKQVKQEIRKLTWQRNIIAAVLVYKIVHK